MENMSRNKFYHVRHPSIVANYLHLYRYLLVLDADNLVVNISKSLDSLITPNYQTKNPIDMFFHMREGGEVTASTYIIRNSLFSRCFIEYWRSLAPSDQLQVYEQWIPTPNNDNGDLVVAIMNLINSSALLQCAQHITPHSGNDYYDNGLLLCFRLFRGALAQIQNFLPNIKIYFVRESFFRMHLGHTTSTSDHNSLQLKDITCHQNDIIAHGWKQIATNFWDHLGHCNIEEYHAGKGGNLVCKWLNEEEEREIVQRKCYWRSPLCYTNHHGSQVNICLNSSYCDGEKFNLYRWELCVKYGQCNPSLTIRQFQRNYQFLPLYHPWVDRSNILLV